MEQRAAEQRSRLPMVDEFHYPDESAVSNASGWEDWLSDHAVADSDGERTRPLENRQDVRAFTGHAVAENLAEGSVEAALRRAFEEGRIEGQRSGLAQGRAEEREVGAGLRAQELETRARAAAEVLNGFVREQERTLHLLEHEVVQLALALAARILRREAQMDPLLLTGAVRVALGQLSESTRVVLQVPEEDLALWSEAMRLVPNLAIRPTVVAGEGMKLGECRIQTEMGSVDLGLNAQLLEIERGFFDRVGSRPAPIATPIQAVPPQPTPEVQDVVHPASAPVHTPPDPQVPVSPAIPRVTPLVSQPTQSAQSIEPQYLDEPPLQPSSERDSVRDLIEQPSEFSPSEGHAEAVR